jgi:hypothetical protein
MIVKLTGGLGNQMFQYAFGLSQSTIRGRTADFHWCRSSWDYQLDKYKAGDYAHLVQPIFCQANIYDEKSPDFDPGVHTAPDNTYFRGYWQSETYFANSWTLRRELKLKEPTAAMAALAEQIHHAENSVFIHVRHGDYLSNPETGDFHGVLPDEYYFAAVDHIRSTVHNPSFFIFSDDPDWCMRSFLPGVFISAGPQGDLFLMNQCRHAIIANSTYSWWGAWLGDAKVVVGPKRWFKHSNYNIMPERWIKL